MRLISNLIFIGIFIIGTPGISTASPDSQAYNRAQYISKYRDIAIGEMRRTGIPASIKLAQGILESADGTSYLAVNGNNHFGIKCGGDWNGPTVFREDDDFENGILVKSCFRKYSSAEHSYIAHSDFLSDPRKTYRYGFLFDYGPTEYRKWAHGLQKAGYATNPTYAEKLIRLIEENQLYQFDHAAEEVHPLSALKRNNGARVVVADNDDTPSGLATRFQLRLSKLLKYNDLERGDSLKTGQFVYLQPKRKKYRGKQKNHLVLSGESMYHISQRYGIKLECLYKKNLLVSPEEPAAGSLISLKKKLKIAPSIALELVEPELPNPVPPVDEPVPHKTHEVIAGETLYSISRLYGLTVDQLRQLNNLDSNLLSVGQILKVE